MSELAALNKCVNEIEETAHDAILDSPLFDICKKLLELRNKEKEFDQEDIKTLMDWYTIINELNPLYMQHSDNFLLAKIRSMGNG